MFSPNDFHSSKWIQSAHQTLQSRCAFFVATAFAFYQVCIKPVNEIVLCHRHQLRCERLPTMQLVNRVDAARTRELNLQKHQPTKTISTATRIPGLDLNALYELRYILKDTKKTEIFNKLGFFYLSLKPIWSPMLLTNLFPWVFAHRFLFDWQYCWFYWRRPICLGVKNGRKLALVLLPTDCHYPLCNQTTNSRSPQISYHH